MKLYHATYTLRNGARGVLHVICASSCDAILIAIEQFGDSLRACGARPA